MRAGPTPGHEGRRATIHVLHVDDEPSVLELTAAFLEGTDARFDVTSVEGVPAALERLRTGAFDCVVSDYDMPARTGIEFLEAVRERDPELPFVLFTGKGSEEVASDAISAGVTDYLQKGADTDQFALLANRVANAVGRYRAVRDLERRSAQHEAVAELGRHALEGVDGGTLLDEATALVVDSLDVEFSEVLELEPAGNVLRLRAGTGWTEATVGATTVDAGPDTPAGRTLHQSAPLVIGDLGADGRFDAPPLLEEHGVTSSVLVVIGPVSDPWGVLGAHTARERGFTAHDVTFVENVANVLAAAIERRETEERLRESERRFREMAELSPDGVFRLDTDGVFTYVSPVAERLLGDPPGGALGTSFQEYVTEGTLADAVEGFTRTVGGEVVTGIRVTMEGTDGVLRDVEVSASPIVDDGEVVAIQGIARDVRGRKRRERELQESRARYEALVRNFPNGGVFLFDTDLEFTLAGGTDLEETGLTPAMVVGWTPSRIFPPENAAVLERHFRATLEGEQRSFEDAWQGRTYWIETIPIRNAGDEMTGGMAVAQNVTERRRQERELEEGRARYETLVENLPNGGVFLFDGELRFTLVGGAKLEEQGISAETVVGLTPADLFPPEHAAVLETNYRATLAGERRSFEDTWQGRTYAVETVPVRDTDGEVVAGMAVAQDVTEREERERELERRTERLDAFTSVVSHDLRNPLSVVRGRLELAAEECDSEHIGAAVSATDRMATLIEDLLRLAREGREVDERRPVSLAPLAEECWQHVRTGTGTLVVESERTVMADENRLRQLFENLFRNSVEHSSTSSRPEAGDSVEHSSTSSQRPVGADDTVEHSSTTGPRAASETDPGVTVAVGDLPDGFYVEDDGPGIPEDRRSKVTDAGYSTREGGTGFGLGIVAAIVEAHGWTLTVTESEDGGARFEVTGVESTTSA